jgi:DNA-damage-inducible protein J
MSNLSPLSHASLWNRRITPLTVVARMSYYVETNGGNSAMNRTATVRARIEPSLKTDVEKLLSRLGITTTEAITMFFSQIRLRKGLPFMVELPSEITRQTFEATNRGAELHHYENLDEMFKALDKC